MSDWQMIRANGWLHAIANCYHYPEFPMEVRSLIANWLEQHQSALNFDADNPTHHQHIFGFIFQMIHKLDEEAEAYPVNDDASYFYKIRLKQIISQIKLDNSQFILSLFKKIQQSLSYEMQEVLRLRNLGTNYSHVSPQSSSQLKPFDVLDEKIMNDITQTKLQCACIDNMIQELNTKYSEHCNTVQPQEMQGFNTYTLQNGNSSHTAGSVAADVQQLAEKCGPVFIHLMECVEKMHTLVLEELELYRDEQSAVANGKLSDKNLDKIQKWFDGIYECITSIEQRLHDFHNLSQNLQPQNAIRIQSALEKTKNLRMAMVGACLVIETQPSQIIRKDTKFGPVVLRVLFSTGNVSIEDHSTATLLINEEQTRVVHEKCKPGILTMDIRPLESAALKMGNKQPLVLHKENKIELKDIRASDVIRKVKRGEKTVTEEKFCLYFQITVNMQGTPYKLWTMSLPMTITSHPNQEGKAWGTILWDNAFRDKNRQLFKVPEAVPWNKLIDAIDLRFMCLTDVRRPLSNYNKTYLKEKLFGKSGVSDNAMVSWKQFCKDPFNKKPTSGNSTGGDAVVKKDQITFWEWVYSCWKVLAWSPDDPKLASLSLKRLWGQDKIVGFILEADMTKLLMDANAVRPGTFILRFSERNEESIGICYYNHKAQTPSEALVKLKPYSIDDLKQLSLQKRILKSPLIAYFHPDIPKESAFDAPNKTANELINGYLEFGIQEYFSESLLRRFQPGLPEQSYDTLSPSSHSYLSYSSQVLSPSSSHKSNQSSTSKSNISNDNPTTSSVLGDDNFSNQYSCSDRNDVIENWMNDFSFLTNYN